MKVKFGGYWYEVAAIHYSFGVKWYEIYDEPDDNPDHTDFIHSPEAIMEE